MLYYALHDISKYVDMCMHFSMHFSMHFCMHVSMLFLGVHRAAGAVGAGVRPWGGAQRCGLGREAMAGKGAGVRPWTRDDGGWHRGYGARAARRESRQELQQHWLEQQEQQQRQGAEQQQQQGAGVPWSTAASASDAPAPAVAAATASAQAAAGFQQIVRGWSVGQLKDYVKFHGRVCGKMDDFGEEDSWAGLLVGGIGRFSFA